VDWTVTVTAVVQSRSPSGVLQEAYNTEGTLETAGRRTSAASRRFDRLKAANVKVE
jgi:hypothetical protein